MQQLSRGAAAASPRDAAHRSGPPAWNYGGTPGPLAHLGPRDFQTCLAALEGMYSALDAEEFPPRVLTALQTLIPYDAGAVLVVDRMERRVVAGAQEPAALALPDLRSAYEVHLEQHPLYRQLLRTPERAVLRMSDFLTTPRFRSLPLYQSLYARFDARFQLSTAIPTTPHGLGWIELSRRHRDFSERDRAMLDLLRPHLTQAMRTISAVAGVREWRSLLRRAAEELAVGVVALTPTLTVRRISPRGGQLLEAHFAGWRAGTATLPARLAAWARVQLVRSAGAMEAHEPLVIERASGSLTVRLLCGGGSILLLLQESSPSASVPSLTPLRLSPREVQVLTLLSEGKSNPEIGQALCVSPRTVDKHLEHIYIKLGVKTRVAAVARALGVLQTARALVPTTALQTR